MKLRRETLPTRTSHHRVRITHLEPALLQIIRIIQLTPTHKQRALRIDHYIHPVARNHNIPVPRTIHQIHLILQPRAPPTYDRNPQRPIRPTLLLQQPTQMARCRIQHLYQLLIPYLVIHRCHTTNLQLFLSSSKLKIKNLSVVALAKSDRHSSFFNSSLKFRV